MSDKKISVVFPVYLPTPKHKDMTDKSLYMAKERTSLDLEWVIVETCSKHYMHDADIYIHESNKTTPNISVNNGFSVASGDYVCFLANDVFVGDGWAERMLECFEKEDCGISTLGNNEHGDVQQDKIVEDVYFSVCMIPKHEAWLDRSYNNLYDDTDLIMRLYSKGLKSYKNLSCIVEHLRHATYGVNDLNSETNVWQRDYFRDKWKDYANTEMYKRLA